MFSPTPIAEHEATGVVEEIYHDIRRTLRVTGVTLNFRTWATFERFFAAMWSSMAPIAGTVRFEAAADAVRARAATAAVTFPRLDVPARVALGESQRFQIARALELYHYINPKLLVFTIVVRRALEQDGRPSRQAAAPGAALTGGAPPTMAAMEMVEERPRDVRVRRLFRDMTRTMRLPAVNSDYRTLALWPDYLEAAWHGLKPLVRSDAYGESAGQIWGAANHAADALPVPSGLDRVRLKQLGEHPGRVLEITTRFERLLPALILNIALWSRDWTGDDALGRSPFPVEGSA